MQNKRRPHINIELTVFPFYQYYGNSLSKNILKEIIPIPKPDIHLFKIKRSSGVVLMLSSGHLRR